MVFAADDCCVGIAPVEHCFECKLWHLGIGSCRGQPETLMLADLSGLIDASVWLGGGDD